MFKAILLTLLILGSLVTLFLLTTPKDPIQNTTDTPTAPDLQDRSVIEERADVDNKPRLLIGDPDAPVTLVEYADFKCPACNQFHHTVGAQLRDTYVAEGLVNIEFRNYPFLGPDSGIAARGSYCSYDQGVFTQYHDTVYNYLWDEFYTQGDIQAEFRDVLTSDKLTELISDDLRDVQQFTDCINSTDYNAFIDADLLLGADDGISGTPGFTIAGRKINGPSNLNTFQTLLEIELDNQ